MLPSIVVISVGSVIGTLRLTWEIIKFRRMKNGQKNPTENDTNDEVNEDHSCEVIAEEKHLSGLSSILN